MLEDPNKLIAELENNIASLAMEKENSNQSFHEEFVILFPEDNRIHSEDYSEELDENCFYKNIPKEFIANICLSELKLLYLHHSGSVDSDETEDSEISNQYLKKYTNYAISFESIIIGEEKRTMIVIRNIPRQYTPRALFEEISIGFYGKFNYFYLPFNNETKRNNGFALVNFISSFHLISFYDYYQQKSLKKYNDKRKLLLFYSKFVFEDKLESDPLATKNIIIPLKYYKLFQRIYRHSVCVVKEKNIYSDGYFLVKSIGKKYI